MASSLVLDQIITLLAEKHGFDKTEAIAELGAKGLLPQKMLQPEKPAQVGPKLSPAAKRLMTQYELDADDLTGVTGTGKDGKIKAEDLSNLIKSLKED